MVHDANENDVADDALVVEHVAAVVVVAYHDGNAVVVVVVDHDESVVLLMDLKLTNFVMIEVDDTVVVVKVNDDEA